jgi:tRNA(Phe) wybutosine-synthesizing methylase Tyw3
MKLMQLPIILGAALVLSSANLLGQTLTELQGKWTLKKQSDRLGGEVVQTLQIKDDKFTYRVQSKAGETVLYATGKVKVEKLGAFKLLKATDIQGGYTETDLQAINDDRVIIYVATASTLTLAMNFDQEREGEKAEADAYTKVKE